MYHMLQEVKLPIFFEPFPTLNPNPLNPKPLSLHETGLGCRMYRKGMPLKDFLETINSKPLAKHLFVAYCQRLVGQL